MVDGNYFYAFLAESAPQTNRDRAFSAPLSFPSPINYCPLCPFPAKIQNKGRSREMQSVVWNPTHCSAQQTLDTSCSSPLPLLHHKVSFSLPVSFFFFFFFPGIINQFLLWRWIFESRMLPQSCKGFFGAHVRSANQLRRGTPCHSLRARLPSFTQRRLGSFFFLFFLIIQDTDSINSSYPFLFF